MLRCQEIEHIKGRFSVCEEGERQFLISTFGKEQIKQLKVICEANTSSQILTAHRPLREHSHWGLLAALLPVLHAGGNENCVSGREKHPAAAPAERAQHRGGHPEPWRRLSC